MNYLEEYDKTNPLSIEKYAQRAIGKTFQDIIDEDMMNQAIHEEVSYGSSVLVEDKRNKGKLGQIIEERFFHYKCNNDARPDFPEAGVELKVTPYKIGAKGKLSAKERLILTMIDYLNVVNEEFETSHMWNKARLILLMYYLYDKEAPINLDYRINYVKLFTPPEQDIKIIKHDFDIIVEKIREGKAHELSEGDTLYLGAATKGATSNDRTKQPFSDELAKPRAFSFKNSYMTYVLNNYIVPGKDTYEPIMKSETTDSFEDYVVSKISKHTGKTVAELCDLFEINVEKKPKNLEALLAYRMLGIKGNHAEEFEKANVVVKAIRIEKNNKIREHMSFPTFKFKELAEEEWEDATFADYLRETRFLFVVYKYDENNQLRLKGCQFWNIPYTDLEEEVRSVWKRTQEVVRNGVQITVVNGIRYNNFPGPSENRVSHVRPHARNAQDTYELPNGSEFTKQCFWLNNTYILSQLDKRFFD